MSIVLWFNHTANCCIYKFVTIDSNGVNAFFIDPGEFDADFVDNLSSLGFQDNFYQVHEYKMNWEKRFELIQDANFFEIK